MNTRNAKIDTGDAQVGSVDLTIMDNIAWLRVNNPRRHNAMSLLMWHELAKHVKAVQTDADVRVLVVTGTGNRAFVSGADVSEFGTQRDSPDQVKAYQIAVHEAQEALELSDKPTVALINGICIGGGIGIALSCDLRFCSSSARFCMPAARLGLGYDIAGIRRAVQVMGYANVADIFFSARTFEGFEALRLGLANRCFDAEHFDLQARAALNDIAGNAPLTLRAAKLALRHVMGETQESQTIAERAISDCFASDDYREGQQAFQDKRSPAFRGR